jgi:pimeloyl-ACP methyl ester carboxylesterase
MSRSCRSRATVLCIGLLLSCECVPAQTPQSEAAPPSSAALQAMALGPQQAQLAALLGRWDVEIVLSNGATPAQHSQGKADYAWVVKGRWLGCHLRGQMLGAPYEQFTILGYDSYARNTVEVAVESLDNSMLLSRGAALQSDQPVTMLLGELDEYTSAVLHRPYKVLLKRVSPDRHVVTVLGFDDSGHEVPKVEFRFSREKAR